MLEILSYFLYLYIGIFILTTICSLFSAKDITHLPNNSNSLDRTNYFPNKCSGCKNFNGINYKIGDRYNVNALVDCTIGKKAKISDGCNSFSPKCTGCQSDCFYLREGTGPSTCDYGHKYLEQLNKPCFQYAKKDYFYD